MVFNNSDENDDKESNEPDYNEEKKEDETDKMVNQIF
jgi:hypothetical protein